MTQELQRAMAGYEEARFRYRKAVLASLDGASSGEAIRQAIRAFQRASADLKRLQGLQGSTPRPAADQDRQAAPSRGARFLDRLLAAG